MASKTRPPRRPQDPFSEQAEALKVPPAVLPEDASDIVTVLSKLRGSAFERRLRPLPFLPRHRKLDRARQAVATLLDVVDKLESTPDDPMLAEAIAVDHASSSDIERAAIGSRLAGSLLMVFRMVLATKKVVKSQIAERIVEWARNVDVEVSDADALKVAFVAAEVRAFGSPRAAVDEALRELSYPPLAGNVASDLGTEIQEQLDELSQSLMNQLETAADVSDAHALTNVLERVYAATKEGSAPDVVRQLLILGSRGNGIHLDEKAQTQLLLPYGESMRSDDRSIVAFGGPRDAALRMANEFLGVSVSAIRNRRHGRRGAPAGAAKALLRRPAATENRVRFALSLLGLEADDVDDVVPTLVERVRAKKGMNAFRAMSSVQLTEKSKKTKKKGRKLPADKS